MYKILIVEDDKSIADIITKNLVSWGYSVESVKDFNNVLKEFSLFLPHIVLMDISLPFFNGYHWCEKIREISKVPIIFISSAAENINMVMAMNMGADDFIAKPFDKNVLTAKINALLRRTYDFSAAGNMNILEHKGAFLNTDENSVTFNGKKLLLSKNEYRILLCLFENKEKVVSREKLMEKLWQTDQFVDENTLTVNVNRLRKKLDEFGLKDFIETRFGVGYMVK